MSKKPGTLYVVATPIGNLDDLSRRAGQILAQVDLVLAEDTRHSGRLLEHLGLKRPMCSLHEHNERQRSADLLERLAGGESMALVCDAGTPLISDPGYQLLAAARERALPVSPVPGPCAAIAALSVAGLPTDRFIFEGFLPARGAARRTRLEALSDETRTLLFYESPRRIGEVLTDLCASFGTQRRATLAREMTKRFEQIMSGTLEELRLWAATAAAELRGEIVLVIAGADPAAAGPARADAQTRRLVAELLAELPAGRAAAVAARVTGLPRKLLYALALEQGQTSEAD